MEKLIKLLNKSIKYAEINHESKDGESKYYSLNDNAFSFESIPEENVCFPNKSINIRKSFDKSILSDEFFKEFKKIFGNGMWICSGFYLIEPGGACGWHTNSDNCNERIYLVKAKESNKSYFRYSDGNKQKTIYDKSYWTVNRFKPNDKEPYLWHCVASETERWSLGFRKSFNTLEGYHVAKKGDIYGDWRFPNQKEEKIHLSMSSIKYLLKENRIEELEIKDIAYKGFNLSKDLTGNNCCCCNGERYINCNIKFPPIVITGYNKFNKKYRLIDGKHRVMKLLSKNIHKSKFYVLDYKDIKNHCFPYEGNSVKIKHNYEEYGSWVDLEK